MLRKYAAAKMLYCISLPTTASHFSRNCGFLERTVSKAMRCSAHGKGTSLLYPSNAHYILVVSMSFSGASSSAAPFLHDL